ncbi:hypothetical protein A2U01_0094242, partial [Trifolium medium]|nr:hypothetical protein [Trifolium medium]
EMDLLEIAATTESYSSGSASKTISMRLRSGTGSPTKIRDLLMVRTRWMNSVTVRSPLLRVRNSDLSCLALVVSNVWK